MFFSSHGMRIAAHEPFTTREEAIHGKKDITSHSFIVENLPRRLMISDTDAGEGIKRRIEDLNALLDAYRSGTIKTAGYKSIKKVAERHFLGFSGFDAVTSFSLWQERPFPSPCP